MPKAPTAIPAPGPRQSPLQARRTSNQSNCIFLSIFFKFFAWKNLQKFCMNFDRIFSLIGTPWGPHFRPFGHHFSILFSTSFSTPFLNGFLMDFGTIFDHFFNTFLYRFGFSRFSWKWHHYGTRARFLWFQHHDFSWFFNTFFDFFRHWFLYWFLIDFLMDFGSILDPLGIIFATFWASFF